MTDSRLRMARRAPRSSRTPAMMSSSTLNLVCCSAARTAHAKTGLLHDPADDQAEQYHADARVHHGGVVECESDPADDEADGHDADAGPGCDRVAVADFFGVDRINLGVLRHS